MCGHARAPFNHFLSLFHMALFFMISGYLYKDNRSKEFQSVKKYTLKKVQTLWVPYFVANLFFILMNNIFIKLGVYCTNPTFLEMVTGNRNELARVYGAKDYVVEIFKAFFMLDNAQLGGALWFLRSLFLITVAHNFLMFLTANKKWKMAAQITVIVICAALAIVMNDIDTFIPGWESQGFLKVSVKAGRQLFAPYLVYALGIGVKRLNINDLVQKYKAITTLGSFILLLLFNHFGRVDLSMGIITNLAYFVVVSILGYLMTISIGYCIEEVRGVSKCLEYLGMHTMCIIALHLLSFKLVSYVYLYVTNSEPMLLASFPVLDNASKFLWIAYSVIGVVVPVIFYQIYKCARIKIKNTNVLKKS